MSAATTTAAAKAHPNHGGDAKNATPPALPFVRAAHEHTELAAYDDSQQLDTATHGPKVIELPTGGYARSVALQVDFTGGTGGSAVVGADGPWDVFSELTLEDTGGADLIETINGFEAFLIAKYGGYSFAGDPKLSRAFSALDANGNGSFQLRVPISVGRDGLGALENMNAAQPFKLRYRINDQASIFSTVPVTLKPVVRVRAMYEGWTKPASGEQPPALGTVQNWSKQTYNVNAGSQTVRLTRVGANIRNLILIFRDVNGVRQEAGIPDQLEVAFDNRPSDITIKSIRQAIASDRYGYAANNWDAGVEVLEYTHENGHPGLVEMNDLWQATTQASKLQLKGSFQAAGTLTVLTNDVIVPAAA